MGTVKCKHTTYCNWYRRVQKASRARDTGRQKTQGGRPRRGGEGGLAETGRQVTVGHYKKYTYNIPQLVQKSPEGKQAC